LISGRSNEHLGLEKVKRGEHTVCLGTKQVMGEGDCSNTPMNIMENETEKLAGNKSRS
jgi:hypothetical protein